MQAWRTSFSPLRLDFRIKCTLQRRTVTTTVYALGEGWTGALGSGRLDQSIPGHKDDDYYYDASSIAQPIPVYTSTTSTVKVCDVGWAHSALVLDSKQVLWTGRPHELSAILRLARLPNWMRRYAVKETYRSTVTARETQGLDPTDVIGRLVTFFGDLFLSSETDWEKARAHSSMVTWTEIDNLPEKAVSVACSAGFTAVIGESGKVYTFGLNGTGQCGVGFTSNNVWAPTAITGLSKDFAKETREDMEQSHPIQSVALGFQHGICLNTAGEIFSWGKGNRGQLGHDQVEAESYTAMPISKVVLEFDPSNNEKPVYKAIGKITQISSGLIHCAALEDETNNVYIWGKNILPDTSSTSTTPALDARFPVRVSGLPDNKRVLQISCGSHHTSMLLEDGSVWAVGIATDTQSVIHEPVCLVAASVVGDEDSVLQFSAHMDRTTIVTASNRVYQVQLWAEEENQNVAVFTPDWVDALLTENPTARIKQVHRSWLHTIIVTESD